MSGSRRLSSLLVRDGVIGVKRMEQAFQRQVIYGGALDTILLEMGIVSEDKIAEYLSLAAGLPAADRDLLEFFDPRAVQVCPRDVAEHYHVAPLAFDGDALRVLVTEPVDLAMLEALATRLGTSIQPFVVPEFRFALVVERLFGVPTPSRYLALASKLAEAARSSPPEPKVVFDESEAPRFADRPPSRTGPMSTDAITRAVAAERRRLAVAAQQPAPFDPTHPASSPAGPLADASAPVVPVVSPVDAGGAALAPSSGFAPPPRALATGGQVDAPASSGEDAAPAPVPAPVAVSAVAPVTISAIAPVTISAVAPVTIPAVAPSATPALAVTTTIAPAPAAAAEGVPIATVDPTPARVARAAPHRPAPSGEGSGVVRAPWRGGQTIDPQPLEPRAAIERLRSSEDRDGIFGALVRGVRSRTTYAALLVVQGELAFGRVAIDRDAADASEIVRISVPLAGVPAFQGAVSGASPYIGPIATRGPLDETLARMGGVVPPTALLLPVTIRDRVIALVYAHRGAEPVSIAELAEVLPLAGEAALAMARLIVKAKAQGYRKVTEESGPIGEPRSSVVEPVVAPPLAAAAAGAAGAGSIDAGSTDDDFDDAPEITIDAELPPPVDELLDVVEAGGPDAQAALDEAAARTTETIAALRQRFPGKLWLDRYAAAARPTRASQHGPLLALTVRLGAHAGPLLAELIGAADRATRYYATLAAQEVRADGLAAPLAGRLFDADYGIRAAAVDALRGCPAAELEAALVGVRNALHGDMARARAAANALGELRDVGAVPDLFLVLDRDHTTAEEARRALVQITKHDFGTKARKWRAWWEKNLPRHRIEWMIEALGSSEDELRLSSSEELKRLTGEHLGYHHDLPKREREEARARWQRWWDEIGRSRFVRDAARGGERDRPTAVLPPRR